MINITEKAKCCGCSACANACPKNCIDMKRDDEGFQYPFVDKLECISCGLCERVCPILNPVKEVEREQKGYLVQIKDDEIRRESTSGGAFTAIAQYVIQNGGVVFGVAFDEKFQVIHKYVERKEDLKEFRNSKYVQSNIGDSYRHVNNFLKAGRLVCFSGTPCQVEGLTHYLHRTDRNLILVDVVCRAVPSPLIWDKYLEAQKEINGMDIQTIKFRDKQPYGYKYSNFTITAVNQLIYHNGVDSDPMLRAFFSNICDRPSCYHCSFKKRYRVSDFTLWDCFHVDDFDFSLDDDKGTNRVLVHTSKGQDIFEKIKNTIQYSTETPDKLVNGVHEMFCSVDMNPKRNEFFRDANLMDGFELFRKYFPETFKTKTEKMIRRTICKLGIYNFVKKKAKKVIKNPIRR